MSAVRIKPYCMVVTRPPNSEQNGSQKIDISKITAIWSSLNRSKPVAQSNRLLQSEQAIFRNTAVSLPSPKPEVMTPYKAPQVIRVSAAVKEIPSPTSTVVPSKTLTQVVQTSTANKKVLLSPKTMMALAQLSAEYPEVTDQSEASPYRKEKLSSEPIVSPMSQGKFSCKKKTPVFTKAKGLALSKGPADSDKELVNLYKCDICHKEFLQQNHCKLHMKLHNGQPSLDNREKKYKCRVCHKGFGTPAHSRRHEKNIHKYVSTNRARSKCPNCDFQCWQSKDMIEHISQQHPAIAIEATELTFESEKDFQEWKTNIERETASFYTLNARTKKKPLFIRYYKCHRNGIIRTTSKGIRSNIRGTNKISTFCPASIIAESFHPLGGKVHIKFIPVHIGHQCEANRLRLSKHEKEGIVEMISSGMSVQDILRKIHETAIPGTRLALTNSEDIRNISYSMNFNITQNSNNVMSTDNWVAVNNWAKQLINQNYNSVLLYRLCEDENTSVSNDDLILGFMNELQQSRLSIFGRKILFIDSVNETNKYNIQLTSLMVVDDKGEGFPVAFLWSTKQTEDTFLHFFTAIKQRVGNLQPEAFISDDCPMFYNAFCKIFQSTKFFISDWHLKETWQEKLSSGPTQITDLVKREKVRNMLQVLLNEVNITTCRKQLSTFMKELTSDVDTAKFGAYFIANYVNRIEQWAASYRIAEGINTTMVIEKWHNALKYNFRSKEKRTDRLGKTLQNLMKSLEGKLMSRYCDTEENLQLEVDKTNQQKEKVPKRKLLIKRAHKAAVEMAATVLVIQHENSWIVTSSLNSEESFEVTKQTLEPNHTCGVQCESCNICIHELRCDCQNSQRKYNTLCKHIHVVCMAGNYLPDGKAVESIQQSTEDIEIEYVENLESHHIDSSENLTESETVSYSSITENDSLKNFKEQAISSVLSMVPEIENFISSKQCIEVIESINTLKNICQSLAPVMESSPST